jgi:hypothetical protein
VTTDVDVLQFHDLPDQASAINIGEALRTAAARLLDMGREDLQLRPRNSTGRLRSDAGRFGAAGADARAVA